ncbi:MAG: ATP synthase F0 subunit B [Bryobacteraceae bacterium]
MKRLLLVAMLALGTTVVYAQEKEAKGEHTEEAKGELEVPDSLKWANFAILFVGLGFMLAKVLPKNFAERTAAIQKEITEAQAVKRDAEARAAKVEAQVKSLGADIEKFRSESAKEMAHEGERIRMETAAQIQRIGDHAALEIESAGKIARRELRQYSVALALKMAEERVRAKLDGTTEAALIDGFVSQMGQQGSKN